MIVNSNRLRRAIERSSRVPQKDDTMEKRRMRDQVNRPLFFLLGSSTIMNLNTSLLTSIVFNCDNFANKCSLAYTIGLFISSIITTFFLTLNFFSLVVSMLSLTTSQTMLVLIGLFGEGLLARNLFISIFSINGAIEIFIVQSASYVSSNVVLDSSYSLIFVGFSSARIILAAMQGLLERIIGIDTVYRARLSLVLCHSFHTAITVIATFWTISLYADFTSDNSSNAAANSDTKMPGKFMKIMGSIPYYFKLFYGKIILLLLSIGMLVSFFPCMIPFSLNMPRGSKLFISTCCTICDFLGRTIGSDIDKEVDARTKRPEESHELFIFYGDLKYIILFVASLLVSLSIITLSWYDHYLSTTPVIVFCITIVLSFICGVTLTRTVNGITAVISYYIKLGEGSDGKEKEISKEVVESKNTFQDLSTFIIYIGAMLFSIISDIVNTRITKRRSSRDFLIIANPGDLSEATVNMILGL